MVDAFLSAGLSEGNTLTSQTLNLQAGVRELARASVNGTDAHEHTTYREAERQDCILRDQARLVVRVDEGLQTLSAEVE